MSVLVPALFLAAAVVFFVLHPVAVGLEAPLDPDEGELTDIQHRKRVTLLALRDVEYDFHAGKLDEADYLQLKQELADEALQAIDREEEEWWGSAGAADQGEPDGIGAVGEPTDARAVAAMEREIEALRASIREGVICPQCAHPNSRGSRFCRDCGGALPVTQRGSS